jgi:hypothetical protein
VKLVVENKVKLFTDLTTKDKFVLALVIGFLNPITPAKVEEEARLSQNSIVQFDKLLKLLDISM